MCVLMSRFRKETAFLLAGVYIYGFLNLVDKLLFKYFVK